MTPLHRALLWSAGVFVVCTIPGADFGPPPFDLLALDKLAHGVLFLGVGSLWLQARPDKPWLVFLGGIAFGVGIEVWQWALPIGRSPELADALADAIGLVAGMALARSLARVG